MTEQDAVTALSQAIATAFQDPTIQADPELRQLLVESTQKLQRTGQYHQVAAHLNQGLQYWGMAHLHGPKALNVLYQATINDTHGRAYQQLPTGLR